MATIDYAARLVLIQTAITSLLAGGVQSVNLDDGTAVTKLDLGWLTREEARLVALTNRAARRGGAFRVAAPL